MGKSVGTEAFINFLEKASSEAISMESLNHVLQNGLSSIAEDLNLGKVYITLLIPCSIYEPNGIKTSLIIYNNPKGFTEAEHQKTYITQENGTVILTGYPKANTEWDENDKKNIDFLFDLMFLLSGRARLMILMQRALESDSLTGVLNSAGFQKKCSKLAAQQELQNYNSIFINIKNFKIFNKMYGDRNGDYIIKSFANTMRSFIEKDGYFARLGGDNFIVLVKKSFFNSFLKFATDFYINFEHEGELQKVKVFFRAGIYEHDENTNPGNILLNTNIALLTAKKSQHKDIIFFKNDMLERMLHDKTISTLFPQALANNEFIVFYQPKVQIDEKKLCGAEALARWKKEKIISPSDFTPVLEKEGSIKKLDFYIFEQVCRDIKKWTDENITPVRISSNFSKIHLANPKLEDEIFSIIDKYGVDPKYIEIELTEVSDFNELGRMVSFVKTMQSRGIHTSIDDFGTGFSSVNLIKNLPVNVIKLDKSLVDKVGSSSDGSLVPDEIVTKAIVAMASDLLVDVIAEGVETEKQAEFLKKIGVKMVQGYLFDKPMPEEEFKKRLNAKQY